MPAQAQPAPTMQQLGDAAEQVLRNAGIIPATFEAFEREACKTFSDLNVEVFQYSKTDRVRGTSGHRWVLRLSGSAIGTDRLEVTAGSPHEAIQSMIPRVRRARAARRVWVLIEECQRLVGGALDEDFEARIHYELDTCPASQFEVRAAPFRTQAVAYRDQQQAA